MTRPRHEVKDECLRDAVVALEVISTSPYDPDRSSARAALAEIGQKLQHADDVDAITVTIACRHAEVLLLPPGKVKHPNMIGEARRPIREALEAKRSGGRS
jgi:hypothetical protein